MPAASGSLGAAIFKGRLVAAGGEGPSQGDQASVQSYALKSQTWSQLDGAADAPPRARASRRSATRSTRWAARWAPDTCSPPTRSRRSPRVSAARRDGTTWEHDFDLTFTKARSVATPGGTDGSGHKACQRGVGLDSKPHATEFLSSQPVCPELPDLHSRRRQAAARRPTPARPAAHPQQPAAATRAGRSSAVRVRQLHQAADDGYRSELVTG